MSEVQYDLVTKEMIDLQIKSLEALVKAKDAVIDYYLDMFMMISSKPQTFGKDELLKVREMIKVTQSRKNQYLQEIEIKKSVRSFL